MNKTEKTKTEKKDVEIPQQIECNGYKVELKNMTTMKKLRTYLEIVRKVQKLSEA